MRFAMARWHVATTKLALLSMLLTAVLVTTATVAFACTQIMGPLTLTPNSGPAGTVVSTTATGLKPFPARYDLFFGGTCMKFSGKLLKTITTNASGGWTNVTVTIPRRAALGQHSLCGVEAYPNAAQTATSHNDFTVV